MIINFLEEIFQIVNLFDLVFILILIYFTIQCTLKGFSLSLISFMKWIISTVLTIILVPKFQPTVSDYIESEFINNVGLGVAIFAVILFSTILIGKSLNKAVTWTGVGSVDKSFGFVFGIFKGYIVAVCVFSILNWFYPFKNWGISVEKAVTFKLINNGSKILVDEFPTNEDFINTKEKIEKI